MIECDAGKPEYRDWYIYFIEQKVSLILTYGLMLLISLVSGRLLEAPIFLVFWKILRSVTGGYHASSRVYCFMMSVGIFLVGVWGIPYVLSIAPYATFGIVIVTTLIVVLYAPVIHPHLFQESHHRKNMRRLSIIVLSMEYLVIGISLLADINLNYIMVACSAMFLSSILLLVAKIIKQEGRVLDESHAGERID